MTNFFKPKVVLFAGGLGTRIAEGAESKPKPLVEIGQRPILWHIMKYYYSYGFDDFIICAGYKDYMIKEYFINYKNHVSDLSIDFKSDKLNYFHNATEDWKVTIVNTGEHTLTGGRLSQVEKFLGEDPYFCLTYSDGLADINLTELLQSHINSGKIGTVTAVKPPGRFGALELDGLNVSRFIEKPLGDGGYINGGFFVMNSDIFKHINFDETFEDGGLKRLAESHELQAYIHLGYWQPMDTVREKKLLEELWMSGNAPWHVWQDGC